MRKIPMLKIKEVLRLRFLNNLSYRQVEVLSGASKSSVSEYCRRFEIIPHTIEAALALSDEELDALLHPEKKLRLRNDERPLPDMNTIHSELKRKGVTLLLLWQEHRETHPNGYGYTQFGEYYRRYASTISPSMRQIHYAGDKLFVDYSGGTVPIVDSSTGEISKAQIFVCVLGASGYTFVHASPSQSTADFIDSHNRAFRFYGGVPNILVPECEAYPCGAISKLPSSPIKEGRYNSMRATPTWVDTTASPLSPHVLTIHRIKAMWSLELKHVNDGSLLSFVITPSSASTNSMRRLHLYWMLIMIKWFVSSEKVEPSFSNS